MRDALPLRVNQHGERSRPQPFFRIRDGESKGTDCTFYSLASLIHRLGKGHVSADGGGFFRFQHQHREAAPVELINGARGEISSAPDDDQVF